MDQQRGKAWNCYGGPGSMFIIFQHSRLLLAKHEGACFLSGDRPVPCPGITERFPCWLVDMGCRTLENIVYASGLLRVL